MKRYKLIYQKEAVKHLNKLTVKHRYKIYLSLEEIAEGNETGKDIKKMKGSLQSYRLRIGNYRVLYSKYNDLMIIDVIDVDVRGNIYK